MTSCTGNGQWPSAASRRSGNHTAWDNHGGLLTGHPKPGRMPERTENCGTSYAVLIYVRTRSFKNRNADCQGDDYRPPSEPLAWKYDLQYMWGSEFLVAPNCSDDSSVAVWLPEGAWYDFWNDSVWTGNQQIKYATPVGVLPLFVKAGSIVPMAPFALSTSFIKKINSLFMSMSERMENSPLTDDDGITESYRTKGELQTTKFVVCSVDHDFKHRRRCRDVRAGTNASKIPR